MPLTATVTGKTGAGVTMTAQQFAGLTRFDLDCENEVLTLWKGGQATKVDVSAATTYTLTVVAPNTFTLTIT